MKCQKCNANIKENDKFCSNCGVPINVENTQLNQDVEQNQDNIKKESEQKIKTYGNPINYNNPPRKSKIELYATIVAIITVIAGVILAFIAVEKNTGKNVISGKSYRNNSTVIIK